MWCGHVWNIIGESILQLPITVTKVTLKKGASNCRLLIIPLDFHSCISCRLPLKCPVTPHNQDHAPKGGKFPWAIPSVAQTIEVR